MGKTPAAVPETDKRAEMTKQTLEEGKEMFNDELEGLKNPAFEEGMASMMSAELSAKEKEKLLHRMRGDFYRGLSEARKQQIRERKEAAMRGLNIELDAEMRDELEVFMRSTWDKYKMLDSIEIKRLAASMDYIAEKQDQRRKQDLKEAKVNAKGARQTEDLLNKELNRRL